MISHAGIVCHVGCNKNIDYNGYGDSIRNCWKPFFRGTTLTRLSCGKMQWFCLSSKALQDRITSQNKEMSH